MNSPGTCRERLRTCTQSWSLDALIAFFTVFNATPAALELVCLLFTSRAVFVSY